MEQVHPLVFVGLTILLAVFFGGILWLMKWNSDRIERNERLATAGPTSLPAPSVQAAQAQAAIVSAPAARPATSPPAVTNERAMPLVEWLQFVQHQPDEHPHLLLYAATGAGKTTLVKAIMASRPGQFCYISPKPGEFGDVAYPTITVVEGMPSYAAIEAALADVLRELGRRLALGVAATHEPVTIVLDDYLTLRLKCSNAAQVLIEVGTIGRSLRMRLITISTTRGVRGLGIEGLGDARANFAEIELPKTSARVTGMLTLDDGAPRLIDLAGVYELSQAPIAPDRWWRPAVAAFSDAPVAEPAWTSEHVRVAAWITSEPSISNREIARRLWPEKDSGGRSSVKAGELRATVERTLCSAVPGVPPSGNGPEQHRREQGTTDWLVPSA